MAASNMRIAMLSVHSCPAGNLGAKDTGGMSVYVRELAGELGKMGVLVDVYTRVHDPSDSQMVELGENVRLIHIKAGKDGDMDKLAFRRGGAVSAGMVVCASCYDVPHAGCGKEYYRYW